MDVNTALQEVLKTALIHDGLARGIREAAKALDKRQAHLCVLASNCDEPMYVKLVEALCAEHQINLIKVSKKKNLNVNDVRKNNALLPETVFYHVIAVKMCFRGVDMIKKPAQRTSNTILEDCKLFWAGLSTSCTGY
eukprot:XP_017949339.1 PREDICTED: 40S ribosomal protein S12 isoform X2 [Xenopus tropicalis]